MNYTPEQIKKYSELLFFTADPELTELFTEQDERTAAALTIFHREVTVLSAVWDLKKRKDKVTYLSIRDIIITEIFNGDADQVTIEKSLDYILPSLISKKLLTQKTMKLTKLGKSLVQAKIAAFYQAGNQSEESH